MGLYTIINKPARDDLNLESFNTNPFISIVQSYLEEDVVHGSTISEEHGENETADVPRFVAAAKVVKIIRLHVSRHVSIPSGKTSYRVLDECTNNVSSIRL